MVFPPLDSDSSNRKLRRAYVAFLNLVFGIFYFYVFEFLIKIVVDLSHKEIKKLSFTFDITVRRF